MYINIHTHVHVFVCMNVLCYIYIYIYIYIIIIIILIRRGRRNKYILVLYIFNSMEAIIYQVLPLQVRVNLGEMAMKGFSKFPKSPKLEP